jgi:hypothetical protein
MHMKSVRMIKNTDMKYEYEYVRSFYSDVRSLDAAVHRFLLNFGFIKIKILTDRILKNGGREQ